MKKTIYRNENEAREYYNDMLNECYPEVEICGYKYQPAVALKEIDPIAYRQGFWDWLSSEELNEEDDGSYSRDE